MIIPENIINQWRLLRRQGDIASIIRTNKGVTRKQVERVMNGIMTNEKAFKAVHTFYKNRHDRNNRLISTAADY